MDIITPTNNPAIAEVFVTHPTVAEVFVTANQQIFLTLAQADSHASGQLDKTVLKYTPNGEFEQITDADYNDIDLGKAPFDSENPLDALSGAAIQNANKDAEAEALIKSLRAEYTELFGEKPTNFFKAEGLAKAIADKKAELATGNEQSGNKPRATGNEPTAEKESPKPEARQPEAVSPKPDARKPEAEEPEANTQTTNPE